MKSEERQIRVNGKDCRLTRTEYELYECMRTQRGRVVSREALLRNVWGFPRGADTRSVDMCIRRLRAKIGFGAIQTIYGKGYVLTV
ncbi:MAG: winged helix-turn-helix transcriptional regulator [Clostridia bacterium]|nr:winged helix-turn-helix transcriptional regulator [Clostridia bacterium]MBQ9251332.1 winged helix-turn-helix transcriptional regulator [Clostridia bacterium]